MGAPARLALAAATAAAALAAAPAAARANAQIVILNNDAPGEGFNDPTPATPVGGNPGVTVGAQRLNMFQFAADRWGQLLDSAVVITIRANFDPLTCTATSAVLGSAGAITLHRDFANAPVAQTWFNAALANKLAGVDLDPATPEISARFNSALNGDPACLGGATWYYGFDNNEGTNQTDLLPVLMHEFGHGLGFQSFVSRSGTTVGQLFQGLPDHYLRFLFDNQARKYWSDMTDAERATSMRNGRRVVWNGPNLLVAAQGFLAPGTPLLRIPPPSALAGNFQVGAAAFGAPLTTTPITGDLLYAQDTAGSPTGCAAYAAGTFTGRVALIDRGGCGFTIKVKNAQDAGATAVVVADNVAGSPPPGLGGLDPTVTISSVRITLADATLIKARLAAGDTVTVSLVTDPNVLAGADEADRVMMNTPDPIVPGSSVSHFDPLTTPNTLMEPAINSDLTAAVDLTLPLFRDVGWYPDRDVDLVPDPSDNCEGVPNPAQTDTDGDLVGDACDDDDDADGAADVADNCPLVPNPGQLNTDGDAQGNACDSDDDNDTVADAGDNCPLAPNPGQQDRNSDGAGDACDDEDSDGVVDATDNCPDAANAGQANADGDALGNACDPDDDNDQVADGADNCPLVANAGQENTDGDADGDACDGDADGDAVVNASDNCPLVANAGQEDADGDAQGDACDLDDDADGAADTADNCPVVPNPDQANADGDSLGNACDPDDDNDTIADAADNCSLVINFDQTNTDGDATGDACDADDDNDGDPDAADNCAKQANPDQLDTDADGQGDVCDVDDDADGVLDTADNCPLVKNIGQLDGDNDGVGDACDPDGGGGGGGGCATSGGAPTGALALGLALGAALRRRRRRHLA
jgi:uncharacterized protein (TIGR03382 family)